jgi:hypothetical protein
MQNLTVHLGSATQLSSRTGPRAPALSTAPVDRPTPPVSGTAARHCGTAHPSGASLPALGLLSGAVRRSGPGPTAPPRRVAPPHPGPPTFSLLFPLCRAAAEPLAPHSHCSTHSPVATPLRPLLLSAQASPPLLAPGPADRMVVVLWIVSGALLLGCSGSVQIC